MENEVFKTNEYKNIAFKDVAGRCFVMNVKDYFTKKPEGFEDKDIFVCESRYSLRGRSFKKMKIFWNVPEHVKLADRHAPLEPKRVMSVFKVNSFFFANIWEKCLPLGFQNLDKSIFISKPGKMSQNLLQDIRFLLFFYLLLDIDRFRLDQKPLYPISYFM